MIEKLFILLIYFVFLVIIPFIALCVIDFLVCIMYRKKSLIKRLFKNSL